MCGTTVTERQVFWCSISVAARPPAAIALGSKATLHCSSKVSFVDLLHGLYVQPAEVQVCLLVWSNSHALQIMQHNRGGQQAWLAEFEGARQAVCQVAWHHSINDKLVG